MAMYAIALVPLFKHLLPLCKQVWFADDATGCDKFEKMRAWLTSWFGSAQFMATIRNLQNASCLRSLTAWTMRERCSKDLESILKLKAQKTVGWRLSLLEPATWVLLLAPPISRIATSKRKSMPGFNVKRPLQPLQTLSLMLLTLLTPTAFKPSGVFSVDLCLVFLHFFSPSKVPYALCLFLHSFAAK